MNCNNYDISDIGNKSIRNYHKFVIFHEKEKNKKWNALQ